MASNGINYLELTFGAFFFMKIVGQNKTRLHRHKISTLFCRSGLSLTLLLSGRSPYEKHVPQKFF
jgi:hypothetical protein